MTLSNPHLICEMTVYSIIAVAMISCVLILVVKQTRPELALILSIASGCIILAAIIAKFTPVLNELSDIISWSGIGSEYLTVMLKALGICYLTQFAQDVCNDFGQTALASKIELCGKITLAAISLPLMISYLEMIKNLVE